MIEITRREALGGIAAASLCAHVAAAPVTSGPVAEEGFVTIGGIDQWVSIRGGDSDAPLMLYLHGGPGEAMSPFQDLFVPYEQDFLVALWDQRGAGKTYARNGRDTTPRMDPDQFLRDGIELAELLRRRWNKRKIVLVGQSWGAALGIRMAKQRPDLFHAYVGTGQPVSVKLTELAQERYARRVLGAKGDNAGLEALDAVVKLPLSDPKRRSATRKLDFGPEDQKFLSREDAFMGPKPWPKTGEVADWIGGYLFTSDILVPKLFAGSDIVDDIGYEFPLPICIIQGKDDHICPTEVARQYLLKMHAPAKAFAEIEGGHFACLTNPDAFKAALHRYVSPHIKLA
jgi:pimeloyl-ACP methyl ester carboxylesterase